MKMKNKLLTLLTAVILFLITSVIFGQAPNLGTTSSFALFTAAGAFTNVGAETYVTGDVGNFVGEFSAFPPGTLVGHKHWLDPTSFAAAGDVALAYAFLFAKTPNDVIGVTLGNGQILGPGVHSTGAASTLNGNLILDGHGDPNALFIFKIGGALSTSTYSNVTLTGSASLCNVYWQINGAFTLGDGSVFRGTIVAGGAIDLLEGSSLLGRGLSIAGAISLHNNVVTNPCPCSVAAPTAGTITQPACAVATGSVVLNGLPSGNWTINPGAISGTGTSKTISGLTAGTYNYTVTNDAGCLSSASANVVITAQPATPVVSDKSVSITSGETFTVTPGVVPLGTTYTWTAPVYAGGVTGGSAQTNSQTNISGILTIASGTGTAIYTVTPTSGSCIGATFTVTVTVTSSNVPVSIGTQPSDNGMYAATGNASFTAGVNGTAPFTYQWQYNNSGTWANVANGTPAGAVYSNQTTATLGVGGITGAGSYQYRIYVTNCTGTYNATSIAATLTVNSVPSAPTVGTITHPTCLVATGSVVLNGLPSGNWTINPGAIAGTGTSKTISGLPPGTYNYTVTTLAGGTSIASADVVINAQPGAQAAPTVTLIQPTCAATTGTITVTAPTGMSYSINGSSYNNTTGIFSLVSEGTYTVTAKNSDGCISKGASVTINAQPATPAAPTTILTQPTCIVATGTITISAPTGIDMTYSIDGSTYTNTTGTFTSVVAGSYNVTAKSAAGCISLITSVTLNATKVVEGCISPGTIVTINAQPAAMAAPIATLTQPTGTVVTGTITVTAPIGAGMTYSIDGLTYTNTTGIFTLISAGTYTLTAKNPYGCISSGTSLTIIDYVTGIDDIGVNSKFEIYPVPNDGQFTVVMNTQTEKHFDILIHNALGSKIFEEKNIIVKDKLEHKIDMTQAPAGLYYIMFRSKDERVIRKIIILK
jgi:hypothetical protein